MSITIIAALAKNYVIGIENRMPWHLSADFQHFKKVTMGKTIVMGRKTFESIGKALPGRNNVILTHDQHYSADDCKIITSIDSIINSEEDLILIGGATLYQALLPYAEIMYLSWVDVEPVGDAYFPHWPEDEWQEIARESHSADAKNDYDFAIATLQRIKAPTNTEI